VGVHLDSFMDLLFDLWDIIRGSLPVIVAILIIYNGVWCCFLHDEDKKYFLNPPPDSNKVESSLGINFIKLIILVIIFIILTWDDIGLDWLWKI